MILTSLGLISAHVITSLILLIIGWLIVSVSIYRVNFFDGKSRLINIIGHFAVIIGLAVVLAWIWVALRPDPEQAVIWQQARQVALWIYPYAIGFLIACVLLIVFPSAEKKSLRKEKATLEEEKTTLEASAKIDARTIEQQMTEIERLKKSNLDVDILFRDRDSRLNTLKEQYGWMHERADKQAESIGDYIEIERVYFCYDRLTDTVPLIVFGIDVYNKSVFDIAMEDAMEGHIEIAGRPLLGYKRIISQSDRIAPSSKGYLTIEQCLSPEEAALIAACKNASFGAFFYFDQLKIIVKERTEFPAFKRTRLALPQHIGHKDYWLTCIAEYDKDNLNRVVQVQDMKWNPHYMSEDNPYTEFTFTVFNGSIYELTVEGSVSGFISFAGSRLSRAVHLAESSARKIQHGETAHIRVHQWLDPQEVELISKAPDVDMRFCFEFSKLIIKVSSDQGLAPTPLYFSGGLYKNLTNYS